MLTLDAYFGKWKHKATADHIHHATELIANCNGLIQVMEADGFQFPINPITGSIVGGESYGGYRPQDCPIGAPASAHKQGMAVDLYDPLNKIDDWLIAHPAAYEKLFLWFEHPSATPHWSHWSIRKPKSGRKFFLP
jgi:hypothetical protein